MKTVWIVIYSPDEYGPHDIEAVFDNEEAADLCALQVGAVNPGLKFFVMKFDVKSVHEGTVLCQNCKALMPPADENPFNQICPNCSEPR